jgi:2'-5' RNA ligase
MRLFISINVPHQLHRYCTQLQSQFPGLKNTHAFHLTIQFLGNDIGSAEPIIDALSKIKFEPFDIEMGDAMPFPSPFRPRGVWIECKGGKPLQSLADNIRNAMSEIDIEADKPFKAHITLGRYKRPPYKKPKTVHGEPHTFTVDRFYLMESELTPEGPRYKTIAEFPPQTYK